MKIIVKDLIEVDSKNYSGLVFRTIKTKFGYIHYKVNLEFKNSKYTLYVSDNPFLANRVFNNLSVKLDKEKKSPGQNETIDMKELEKSLLKENERSTFTNAKLMKLLKHFITEDIKAKGFNE